MKKILLILMILGVCVNAEALDIGRFRELPSCVLAEDLSSIEDLERKGWTTSSAPIIITSAYGNAIDFDGTDDKFTITEYANESVKTILFWVNPDTTTEQFIDLDGGSNYIHVSGGNLTATGFSSPTYYVNGSATQTMSADSWQMVAVTSATAETPTSIKLATDNSNYGDCSLKNLIIFNRVLSAQEIADIYNGTTFDYWQDEVVHWDMSEILPQDVSWKGNDIDFDSQNGLVASTDVVYEDGDWGIEYNGSDELNSFISESTTDPLDPGTGDFTWALKFTGNTTAQYLLEHGAGAGVDGIRIWMNSNKFEIVVGDTDSYSQIASSSNINDGGIYHGVASCDRDGNATIYLNGAIDGTPVSLSSETGTVASDQVFCIGGSAATKWNGRVFDVRYYNAALTTLQVEDLYVQTR